MNAKNQPNKKKVCKEKQFYENTGGPDSEISFQYLAVLVPTASRPGSQNQSPWSIKDLDPEKTEPQVNPGLESRLSPVGKAAEPWPWFKKVKRSLYQRV